MFLATLESCQLWLVLHVVLQLNTNLVCPCRDLLWPNYFIWPINLLSLCEHPLVLSFIVCLQLELINRFSCSSRSFLYRVDRHFPKFDTPNWSIFVKNLFHSSSATVLVLMGHHYGHGHGHAGVPFNKAVIEVWALSEFTGMVLSFADSFPIALSKHSNLIMIII